MAILFADLDALLAEETHLHCCGGFVVTQLYGVARTTNDVDSIGVVPSAWRELAEIGGKGPALHQQHELYLDPVIVATPPENYAERLLPLFAGSWARLNLLRWRPTIWPYLSLSEIMNATGMTFSGSPAPAI